MSRIGKNPVTIPQGITVTVGADNIVTVKGPKGELKETFDRDIRVEVKDNEVTLYYQAMGNDVSITLIKKDNDHVTGSVLGQFDANGERIK